MSQALLDEFKVQFGLQYNQIKNSKLTQWNVEANTTNNALKYVLFKNENINSLMNNNKDTIQTIDLKGNEVYKLSMGTFLKTTSYRRANLVGRFESNKWAVMGKNTEKGQGQEWTENVKIGDFIYITFGQDKLSFLAKITSEPHDLPEEINKIITNDDFSYRTYEIAQEPLLNHTRDITHDKREWLPSGYSTLKKITSLKEANRLLFVPFYRVKFIGDKLNSGIENQFKNEIKRNLPLNQILYGSPGTGKTYLTISKAIEIVAPDFYHENEKNRTELLEKFNELTISNWSETKGQIAFCTFHQSFTYEDFVEGIKPKVVNEKDIIYEVQKDVFKALCDRARTATNDDTDFDSGGCNLNSV